MASHLNSSDRPVNNQNEHHPGSYEQERMLASQKCYETVGGQFIANHPKLDNFMQYPLFNNLYDALGVECSKPKRAVIGLHPFVYDPAVDDIYK
jgi:hypothetical protein